MNGVRGYANDQFSSLERLVRLKTNASENIERGTGKIAFFFDAGNEGGIFGRATKSILLLIFSSEF